MSSVKFCIIDLDSNEPLVAFDSYDEAEECRTEMSYQDVRCIIDTLEDDNGYRL